MTIGRGGQSEAQWTGQAGHSFRSVRDKIVKLDRVAGRRNEVHAGIHDSEASPPPDTGDQPCLFSTLYGHPPNAVACIAFGINEPLPIRRFDCREAAIARHLHSIAAASRHLPYLIVAAPVRAEIDPLSVA